MTTPIERWTGIEARLLRKALRLSVRSFADHTGIAARTIARWDADGAGVEPRPDNQAILDTTLARSDSQAQERFAALLQRRRQGEPVDGLSAESRASALPADAVEVSDMSGSDAVSPSMMPFVMDGLRRLLPIEAVPSPGRRPAGLSLPLSFDAMSPGGMVWPADGDEGGMERRAFLALVGLESATFGLQVNAVATALEALRHGVNRSLATWYAGVAVDEWREIATEYGQTYVTAAPSEVLGALMIDLHALQVAMRHRSDDASQRGLRQVAALLAAFAAQTVANLGDLRGAQRWWRTARRAADESGDSYSMLWVRGREIIRAGYENRPLGAVLKLIDEAEARADGAPVAVLPELITGKAQILALIGDRQGSALALDHARAAFAALPASVTRSSADSIFGWGEERLHFAESFVYSHLGDYGKAADAQAAALRLYPIDDARGPAQIELQRALCLVMSGDTEQGVGHAQKVIRPLPSMHGIRPIANLGQKVLKAIPAGERHKTSVSEYRDCLTGWLNRVNATVPA